MACTRRGFLAVASGAALTGLAACSQPTKESAESVASTESVAETTAEEPEVDLHEFDKLEINPAKWSYDKRHDVYYQLGLPYCLEPASTAYESLAIFVPGAYFTGTKDKDDLYTCEVNKRGKVGSFTPKTAPIVMPINSGNLGAQSSPASYDYDGLDTYLEKGCVYVYAGFRGRSSGYESSNSEVFSGGAPWPAVDLKAAVRYLRYNAEFLPCNTKRVFTFGFSAGGGVSAVMGSSGDSELYLSYLTQIGAATHDAEGKVLSDAIFGSASWCPITSFDTADASYEWMMGQYADNGTRKDGTWTKLLSLDLARAYAAFINEMDLRDTDDEPLTLDETSGELYADGTYYACMLSHIQDAAETFFKNTSFPYTYTPQHLVNASFPGDPTLQSAGAGTTDVEAVTGDASAQAAGDDATEAKSVVYNTQDDYVNGINGDTWWFTLNQSKMTVRITSLGDFVRHLKKAAKDVCAFDAPDRSTIENQLFGVDDDGTLHFSRMVYNQLRSGQDSYAQDEDWDSDLIGEWSKDLVKVDSLETGMVARLNMFSPLYYLSGSYDGFGTAEVAPHWRVNSGIFQTDTSLCTELNLVLALQHYDGVKDVSFTPVWGQGHVLAEAAGTAEDNLLEWIVSCCD